jgi:uncharacterized glyoxalase superfamily metalloenzyme YdcJ
MLSSAVTPATAFADKTKMQHRLFAELSAMFGREVPLYDKSLLVNRVCNQTVCLLLSQRYDGFSISDDQLEKASGERHGAIRIGTPEEYRWVAGFFAAFGMAPHNFYDMTSLGGKSQPIIATAFRSALHPEHRVFTSLLMLENLDEAIRPRVAELLSRRQVFSDRAKELVTKNEEQGGLDEAEAEELIREGTNRIFKWTGQANDFDLYKELCDAGFKIAADIACFQSHHLNHLTPNTLCMDLYTSAMKFALGELDREKFIHRATVALNWLRGVADRDYMKLHFRHLSLDDIKAYTPRDVTDEQIRLWAENLADRLSGADLDLSRLNHSGFKDFTEGPDVDTPVLLRQDSYKALTEPVTFHQPDGSSVDANHTARFGEIEQRFYATTGAGRAHYDQCLANADGAREKQPGLAKSDYDAYLRLYGDAFAEFPKTLPELLDQRLVFGRYSATEAGRANAASAGATDINQLVRLGFAEYEGLRYEDFLPFSAAGIFASNLGQYGTKTSGEKPVYTQATLEEIMGRPIVDPNVVYGGLEAESLLDTYQALGLSVRLSPAERADLENAVSAYRQMLAQI